MKCFTNLHILLCFASVTSANAQDDDNCRSHPITCDQGSISCKTEHGIFKYKCNCYHGWKGTGCTERDYCIHKPCAHGQCNTYQSGYLCECAEGWTGKNCSERMNHCIGNPCGQHGSCYNNFTDFHCSCDLGWQGRYCNRVSIGAERILEKHVCDGKNRTLTCTDGSVSGPRLINIRQVLVAHGGQCVQDLGSECTSVEQRREFNRKEDAALRRTCDGRELCEVDYIALMTSVLQQQDPSLNCPMYFTIRYSCDLPRVCTFGDEERIHTYLDPTGFFVNPQYPDLNYLVPVSSNECEWNLLGNRIRIELLNITFPEKQQCNNYLQITADQMSTKYCEESDINDADIDRIFDSFVKVEYHVAAKNEEGSVPSVHGFLIKFTEIGNPQPKMTTAAFDDDDYEDNGNMFDVVNEFVVESSTFSNFSSIVITNRSLQEWQNPPGLLISAVAGGVLIGVTLALIAFLVLKRKRKSKNNSTSPTKHKPTLSNIHEYEYIAPTAQPLPGNATPQDNLIVNVAYETSASPMIVNDFYDSSSANRSSKQCQERVVINDIYQPSSNISFQTQNSVSLSENVVNMHNRRSVMSEDGRRSITSQTAERRSTQSCCNNKRRDSHVANAPKNSHIESDAVWQIQEGGAGLASEENMILNDIYERDRSARKAKPANNAYEYIS